MKRIFSLMVVTVMFLLSFNMPLNVVANEADETALTYRSDFDWGINFYHSRYRTDASSQYSEEALYLAAKLGVKMIRYQPNNADEDFEEADRIIGLCNKYGIKVMLVIVPTSLKDNYTEADVQLLTNQVQTFAKRYDGKDGRAKIDYIQLWNELEIDLISDKYGTVAVNGQSLNHFYTTTVEGKKDIVEYTASMKVASKAIREVSDAKIVINFSWVAFGPIRYYIQEGVDFDYIGWDWYPTTFDPEDAKQNFQAAMYGGETSDGKKVMGVREAFPDKEVIICESNTWIQGFQNNGGYTPENMSIDKYQPLLDCMKMAYEQDWIKAFCAFALIDSPGHSSESERHYGFVWVEPGGKIIEPKPIYYEYQKLIGGPRNVDRLLKSSVDLKPYEALKVKTQDDTDINQNVSVIQPTIKDDVSDELPTIDIPIIENNNTSDNVEPIVETITVKPDDIYKKTTSTVTHNKLPWILILSVGGGMLVLFSAGFVTFLIIKRKKGL